MQKKIILGLLSLVLVGGCASLPEKGLSTFQTEELFALKHLPCEAVGEKSPWERHEHAFLCNMGAWGTINYMIYENGGQVYSTKLLWKEYKSDNFFPSNRESVEIVLGRLSAHLAPNDRVTMLSFASSLSNSTFYTQSLRIKHEVEFYKNTVEPYYLHQVTFTKR